MNSQLRIPLNTTPAQAERLAALQSAFAEACSALAPVAAQHRCWNRVALHHLTYRQMRERFPGLGSQMVCNAIYSVSRASRVVYQHPASPFHPSRWGRRALPVLRFLPSSPVYFDRHTLSLKAGRVSMFTLDGRMHFDLGLSPEDEQRFREGKLREIVLARDGERFVLTFAFAPDLKSDEDLSAVAEATDWPEYVLVQDPAADGGPLPGPGWPRPLSPAPQPSTSSLP